MTLTNVKWLNVGTSDNQVGGKTLPSGFTPTSYTPAQVSSEGTDKISAHLKGIDNALSSVPQGSAGDVSAQKMNIQNNQTTLADITNLVFDSAEVLGFTAFITVKVLASSPKFEHITLEAVFTGTEWLYSTRSAGSPSGLEISVTNAGQVQYTSPNFSGFSSGLVSYRALTTIA